MLAYTKTADTLTVVYHGKPVSISKEDKRWAEAIALLEAHARTADAETARRLYEAVTAPVAGLKVYSAGRLTLTEDGVFHDGEQVHSALAERILDCYRAGEPFQPLLKLMERMRQNPRRDVAEAIYSWLVRNNMPITPDGHILGYKAVREDYKSFHDGKTDNSIGASPEVEPAACSYDPNEECGPGLHFCSWGYLHNYRYESNARVVIVKVDPAHITSLPASGHGEKARCWKQTIVGEVDAQDVDDRLGTGRMIVDDYNSDDTDYDHDHYDFDDDEDELYVDDEVEDDVYGDDEDADLASEEVTAVDPPTEIAPPPPETRKWWPWSRRG